MVIEHGDEFRVCEECGKENGDDRDKRSTLREPAKAVGNREEAREIGGGL
jgi:hypothetical protein